MMVGAETLKLGKDRRRLSALLTMTGVKRSALMIGRRSSIRVMSTVSIAHTVRTSPMGRLRESSYDRLLSKSAAESVKHLKGPVQYIVGDVSRFGPRQLLLTSTIHNYLQKTTVFPISNCTGMMRRAHSRRRTWLRCQHNLQLGPHILTRCIRHAFVCASNGSQKPIRRTDNGPLNARAVCGRRVGCGICGRIWGGQKQGESDVWDGACGGRDDVSKRHEPVVGDVAEAPDSRDVGVAKLWDKVVNA
jgi:hypothetical protein